MTKKTANSAAATYFDQVKETFEKVQSKMEVPAAAREFVQRGTATAKERADSLHAGANNFATGAEKLTTAFVGGYANLVRGLVDATFANVQHGLSTVEKLAASKSLNEAVQVQADFVRDNAKANFERAKGAAETARTVVAEGAETVRKEFSKLYPVKQAA